MDPSKSVNLVDAQVCWQCILNVKSIMILIQFTLVWTCHGKFLDMIINVSKLWNLPKATKKACRIQPIAIFASPSSSPDVIPRWWKFLFIKTRFYKIASLRILHLCKVAFKILVFNDLMWFIEALFKDIEKAAGFMFWYRWFASGPAHCIMILSRATESGNIMLPVIKTWFILVLHDKIASLDPILVPALPPPQQ